MTFLYHQRPVIFCALKPVAFKAQNKTVGHYNRLRTAEMIGCFCYSKRSIFVLDKAA